MGDRADIWALDSSEPKPHRSKLPGHAGWTTKPPRPHFAVQVWCSTCISADRPLKLVKNWRRRNISDIYVCTALEHNHGTAALSDHGNGVFFCCLLKWLVVVTVGSSMVRILEVSSAFCDMSNTPYTHPTPYLDSSPKGSREWPRCLFNTPPSWYLSKNAVSIVTCI